MKYIIYSILILFLLAVNIESTRLFLAWPVRLNLLLLLIVFAGLKKHNYDFLWMAFVCGLFLDFYHAAPFGSFLFTFLITAWLVSWAARIFWVYELDWRGIGLFMVLALIFSEILLWTYSAFLPGREFANVSFDFRQFFVRLVYQLPLHLLLALPLYALWQRIEHMIAKMESGRMVLK